MQNQQQMIAVNHFQDTFFCNANEINELKGVAIEGLSEVLKYRAGICRAKSTLIKFHANSLQNNRHFHEYSKIRKSSHNLQW